MTDTKREYTVEERKQARIVLGISDAHRRMVPLAELSNEELLERFALSVRANSDRLAEKEGALNAVRDLLKSARKAKKLANARADKAEQTMRAMLDNLADVIKADT